MNRTRRITSVFALTSALGLAASAGKQTAHACSPLDGIIQTPPCASTVVDLPDLGQTDTPAASESIDLASIFSDALLDLVLF